MKTLFSVGRQMIVMACCMTFLAACAGAAYGDVLVVARTGPEGPAGALAGEQIANWPTQEPVRVVNEEPATLPEKTSLVIELAEDFDFHGEVPVAKGSTLRIAGPAETLSQTKALADAARDALNKTIEAPTEQFVVQEDADSKAAVARITITTSTQNEIDRQRISIRTRQLRIAIASILSAAHVIDDSVNAERIAAPARAGVLRVAFFDDLGAHNTTGHNPVWVRETMRDLKDLDVYLVSAGDIQAGALDGQFDVVIMGGGSSRVEAASLGDSGKAAIRRFVRNGGGYVGVCAGAFLAARNKYGVNVAPVIMKGPGGGGAASMRVSADIATLAGLNQVNVKSAFHGGPIISLADDASQFDAKVWATYTEDLISDVKLRRENEEASPGEAEGKSGAVKRVVPLGQTPSVVSARYGKGHVVIFSPHCERRARAATAILDRDPMGRGSHQVIASFAEV